MEEAFEKLKQQGKTDVEGLIKWMKDSKIIDDAKAVEDKARKLLNEAADKSSVELTKFKDTLTKLAEDQKKNLDEYTKSLAEQGPKLLNAVMAGASAFKEAIAKK